MPLDGKNYTDTLTDTEKAAREDLFLWLERFPARVPALLEAVREGRIDGESLATLPCRCVIGTLGNLSWAQGEFGWIFKLRNLPDSRDPIEWFVAPVHGGDTPANSPIMARLEEWIMQWQAA